MMMRWFSIVLIALLSLTISRVFAEGKTIKILSIDGGGVKGIVSARILQEIEKELKSTPPNYLVRQSVQVLAGY